MLLHLQRLTAVCRPAVVLLGLAEFLPTVVVLPVLGMVWVVPLSVGVVLQLVGAVVAV